MNYDSVNLHGVVKSVTWDNNGTGRLICFTYDKYDDNIVISAWNIKQINIRLFIPHLMSKNRISFYRFIGCSRFFHRVYIYNAIKMMFYQTSHLIFDS